MRVGSVWCFASLAISIAAPAARAAEPEQRSVAFSWVRQDGAGSCPKILVIASRIEAHLRRSPFVEPSKAELFVEAAVTPDSGNAWRVEISLSNPAGELLGTRSLVVQDSSCDAVIEPASFAIAIMIAPGMELEERGPASNAPATGAGAATSQPEAAVEAAPPATEPRADASPRTNEPGTSRVGAERERPSETWRARVSLSALSAIGVFPEIAFGAVLGVRVSPGLQRFGGELSGLFLARQGVEARPGAGADFSTAAGELTGFWVPWRGRGASFSLGAGLQSGIVNSDAYGFTGENRDASSWFLSTTLYGEFSLDLTRAWSLLARPGFAVSLWHDDFVFGPAGKTQVLVGTSDLTAQLALGLAFSP